MGQRLKDWWSEVKNDPTKKKKFIAITAGLGAACAIAIGVVAVNLGDISRMAGSSASDLITENGGGYNDAGGLIADIDYNSVIGYDADGSPIYGTKGLVNGVGGYDCFGAPIATDKLVVTGTAADGRAIYGGYSAVKEARIRAISLNKTGDIDYNAIVGYDRNGNPIYGSISGRDDIWGYDANGRPVPKDNVRQTGTTANGMPIYDYSAIDVARDEGITAATTQSGGKQGNINDVDFSNQVGVDRDGNPLYGSKTDPTIIYDANGFVVPSDTNKTGLTPDGKPIYDYSTREAAERAKNGTNGANGTNGSNGSAGANGTAGLNGQAGANGTNGTNGANGSAGANGTNGTVSVVDKPGTNGTNGANGTNGSAGRNGTNGANGANGSTGRDGANGSGYAGMDGQNGSAGQNGSNGSAGANGTNGINGTAGNTGAAGQNGSAGQNGTNGTNGANGTNGKDYTKEINTLESRISTLQKALDDANKTGDITALQDTVKTLQNELNIANKTIEGQKSVTEQQNSTINNYLKVISQLTSEVSELKGLTTDQARSLSERSSALEEAFQNMQGLSSSDKAALEAELLKYKAALAKAESDALANSQSLQSKIDANQAANDAANKSLMNSTTALDNKINNLAEITGSMDNVNYRYTDDGTGNPTITFSPSNNHSNGS